MDLGRVRGGGEYDQTYVNPQRTKTINAHIPPKKNYIGMSGDCGFGVVGYLKPNQESFWLPLALEWCCSTTPVGILSRR